MISIRVMVRSRARARTRTRVWCLPFSYQHQPHCGVYLSNPVSVRPFQFFMFSVYPSQQNLPTYPEKQT